MLSSNRQQLLALAKEINSLTRDKMISSNDVISKLDLPYLEPDLSALHVSKFGSKRLQNYYEHRNFLGRIRTSTMREMTSIARKKLFHDQAYNIGALLKVASYGVGECQEMAYYAAWLLMQRGYYQISIIEIASLNHQEHGRGFSNRDKYSHCLILLGEGVENIEKDFLLSNLNKLSSSILIIDPYLNYAGLANQYISKNNAYLSIFQYHHIANAFLGVQFFFIKQQIQSVIEELNTKSDLKELQEYDRNILGVGFSIEDLQECHETALITMLNEKSRLHFKWGHKNCVVYAHTILEDSRQLNEAQDLNDCLKTGSYFLSADGVKTFVLSDINIPENGVPKALGLMRSKK